MTALSFDYVYEPDGQVGYNNVHITLDVNADDIYELKIISQANVSKTDIVKIVEDLQSSRLRKMNLNLIKDGRVFLVVDGSTTQIMPGSDHV